MINFIIVIIMMLIITIITIIITVIDMTNSVANHHNHNNIMVTLVLMGHDAWGLRWGDDGDGDDAVGDYDDGKRRSAWVPAKRMGSYIRE